MLFVFKQRYLKLVVVYLFFFTMVLFTMVLFNKFAIAASLQEDPKKIPWHISAATVTFDQEKNLYIAQGNVVITGGDTRLEADYVEFSNKTKDAAAQGNVILISGGDSVSCNAITLNLSTQTGVIDKGTIFIQKNNFYLSGENIKKTGKSSYSAQQGSITS